MQQFQAGDLVLFTTAPNGFQAEATGDPVDPSEIVFQWSINPGSGFISQGRYVYGVDSELVRISEGIYQVEIDTTGMANSGRTVSLYGQFSCPPGLGQVVGYTIVEVVAPPITPSF